MGSDSDLPVMKDAAKILDMFGVPHEVIFSFVLTLLQNVYLYNPHLHKETKYYFLQVRIVSAHRTPELMFSYAKSASERGVQMIIAGAGGAAHLPGELHIVSMSFVFCCI